MLRFYIAQYFHIYAMYCSFLLVSTNVKINVTSKILNDRINFLNCIVCNFRLHACSYLHSIIAYSTKLLAVVISLLFVCLSFRKNG